MIYLPSLSSSFSLRAFATSAGVTPAASAAFSCSVDSGDLTSSNSCWAFDIRFSTISLVFLLVY
jgi:hypothetical protein